MPWLQGSSAGGLLTEALEGHAEHGLKLLQSIPLRCIQLWLYALYLQTMSEGQRA